MSADQDDPIGEVPSGATTTEASPAWPVTAAEVSDALILAAAIAEARSLGCTIFQVRNWDDETSNDLTGWSFSAVQYVEEAIDEPLHAFTSADTLSEAIAAALDDLHSQADEAVETGSGR